MNGGEVDDGCDVRRSCGNHAVSYVFLEEERYCRIERIGVKGACVI